MWEVVVMVTLVLAGHTRAGSICGAELGMTIKRLAEMGLGVRGIQDMYDRDASFKLEVPNGRKRVDQIADDLSTHIGSLYGVVQRNHDAIITYLAAQDISSFVEVEDVVQCCNLDPSSLIYIRHLGARVHQKRMCVKESSKSENVTTYQTSKKLISSMEENAERINNLGYQYYSTEDGLHFTYMARKTCDTCCYEFDARKSIPYNEASFPTPRDIVIAIDISDRGHLHLKVEAAKTLLTTLSPSNRIGIVVFCQDATVHLGTSKGDACFSSFLAPATSRNVRSYLTFLSELLTDGSQCGTAVKFIPGIKASFEYFKNIHHNDQKRKKVLVLLTDSDPSDAGSHDRIVQTMAEENAKVDNEVIIQIFSFGTNVSIPTEMLLRRLAETRYNASGGKEVSGSYATIESSENLRFQLGPFYDTLDDAYSQTRPIITPPHVCSSGLGLIVSICKPVVYSSRLEGVTCVDVKVEDLFLNVTYYEQGVRAYMFLINSEGRAIVHPLLPKPSALNDEPFFVDISTLESEEEAQEVIESMKSGGTGYKAFYTNRQYEQRSSIYRKIASHYYWTKVNGTDFAICLVYTDEDGEISLDIKARGEVNFHDSSKLESSGDILTRYQGTVAIRGASSVAFNGSAYKYLHFASPTFKGSPLVNYFTANADDLGRQFKSHIKAEVEFTGRADWVWRDPQTANYDGWIVWRIFVTNSGVLRIYPGTSFRTFNPNLQEWYQNAISNRGKTVFTGIRKESERAIMISSAIFAGSPDGRHSSLDPTVAVVAGEISCNRLYNKMLSTFDACREKGAICFLVDDKGYVLVHTLYIDSWRSPSHLVIMEPAIAKYLQTTGDLSRTECVDLGNYRAVRGWTLAPADWIIEHDSPRFELHQLAGTNILAGITWRDYDGRDTLCDCAKVTKCDDNCDCPCHETNFDYCENRFSNGSERVLHGYRPCPVLEDIFDPIYTPSTDVNIPEVPSYFTTPVPCVAVRSQETCLQISDCEWCPGDEGTKCYSSEFCAVTIPTPYEAISKKKEFIIGLPIALIVGFVLILLCIVMIYMWKRHNKKLHVQGANGVAAAVSKDSYQTKADRLKNGSTQGQPKSTENEYSLGRLQSGSASVDPASTESVSALPSIPTPPNCGHQPNANTIRNRSSPVEMTPTESGSDVAEPYSKPIKHKREPTGRLMNGSAQVKPTFADNDSTVSSTSAPPTYQPPAKGKTSTKTPPEPPPRYRSITSVDNEAPYGNHIAIAMWHNFDSPSLDLSYPSSSVSAEGGGGNSQTEVKKPIEHESLPSTDTCAYVNSPVREVGNEDVQRAEPRQPSTDSGFPSGNMGNASSTTYPKFYV